MKKRLYTTFILLLALFAASGCFQDKSTLDTSKLDAVTIESQDIPDILRVDYLGQVSFAPTVKMGRVTNPDNLSYKWEINQTPGRPDMVEIGNERVLNATITNQIISAAYTLVFTAIDNQHGLEYKKTWPLYVSSAFREGIVVADTKDGQKSDLNLIMDNNITTSYDKGEKILYSIWETATGEAYPSLIESIEYALHKPSALLTKNLITTISQDNDIQMVNCEDYSIYKTVGQIFPGYGQDFNPQSFYTINNGYWVMVNDNVPYVTATNQIVTSFMLPVSGVQPADNAIVVADNSGGAGPYAIWFNSTAGAFYTVAMTFTTPATGSPYTTQGVFDPQNIPNRTAVAGDVSMDGKTATMLLKDNSTGNYEIYGISFSYYDANYNSIPSSPKLKASVPESLTSIIDNAVSVVFNLFDPMMFVATSDKVYAVNFGGGVVSYQEVYTVASGEIAKAKLFLQGRYKLYQKDFNQDSGPIFEAPLDLNANALVLAVNQGGNSGTIEIIPQSNTATGSLNIAGTKKYTGFGKILDFTFQGQ